jgi:hypothetical protein
VRRASSVNPVDGRIPVKLHSQKEYRDRRGSAPLAAGGRYDRVLVEIEHVAVVVAMFDLGPGELVSVVVPAPMLMDYRCRMSMVVIVVRIEVDVNRRQK